MPRRTFILGRSAEADIWLNHDTVSALHAELIVTDCGRAYIVDRASRNGTFVQDAGNWRLVRQDWLNPDGVLRLGKLEVRVAALITRVPSG